MFEFDKMCNAFEKMSNGERKLYLQAHNFSFLQTQAFQKTIRIFTISVQSAKIPDLMDTICVNASVTKPQKSSMISHRLLPLLKKKILIRSVWTTIPVW